MNLKQKIISWNILYDPRIDPKSEQGFEARWPKIQRVLRKMVSGFDRTHVILLQEVHESYLEYIQEFTQEHELMMTSVCYHTIRKCYLVTIAKEFEFIFHLKPENEFNTALACVIDGLFVLNVHLPLDIKNQGSRLNMTAKLANFVSAHNSSIMMGDYNTIPDLGGKEQLRLIEDLGLKVVRVSDTNGNDVDTTFYGFPHEDPQFQGHNHKVILDHCATNCTVISATCYNDIGVDVSDHFPVVVRVQY